jgi:hypothetical protein
LQKLNEPLIKGLIIDEEDVHDLDKLVPAVEVRLGWYLSQDSLPFYGFQLYPLKELGLGVLADDFDVVESELF